MRRPLKAIRATFLGGLVLAGLAAGCGGGSSASTHGGSDGSAPVYAADAAHDVGSDGTRPSSDSSAPPSDAGPADTGVLPGKDSGGGTDAPVDAPVPDGSTTLSPAVACTATSTTVYNPVSGLPAFTNAARGDIVACTSDGTLDTATVESQLVAEADTGVTAITGVAIYRVQYRTTRANGTAATSTARVYLPLVPIATVPTVIVAAHGTEGLAASCATSMDSTSMRDLGLPWASLGYPVIAPDYAGLGTTGVQGYTDNRDTARSVVDSVEALRKFVTAKLSQQVVIDGHSQGGGAALATQGLATEMGLDGTLVAVLAFAPEYYSHLDSLGFLEALESVAPSNPLTISTGVTKCEVATLMEYQFFANYVNGNLAGAGFPTTQEGELDTAIQSLCTVQLGGAIQTAAVHVADWTDPTVRADLLACVYGPDAGGAVLEDGGLGDAGASCTGYGQQFYQYLRQNIIPPDPTGAKVLLVQGLQDQVMPPAQEAACNVVVLEAGGVTPQVCTDSAASHTDVVPRNIGFGIAWAQNVLAGVAPPPCAASALPACSAP